MLKVDTAQYRKPITKLRSTERHLP